MTISLCAATGDSKVNKDSWAGLANVLVKFLRSEIEQTRSHKTGVPDETRKALGRFLRKAEEPRRTACPDPLRLSGRKLFRFVLRVMEAEAESDGGPMASLLFVDFLGVLQRHLLQRAEYLSQCDRGDFSACFELLADALWYRGTDAALGQSRWFDRGRQMAECLGLLIHNFPNDIPVTKDTCETCGRVSNRRLIERLRHLLNIPPMPSSQQLPARPLPHAAAHP